MEQGSTLYSACRSKAQRFLERGSTGVIGAVLNDLLVGARRNNQGHWSEALQCLPEQSSTALGAKLNRDDQSSAQRAIGWSEAQ